MPAGRPGWRRKDQKSHNSSLLLGNVSFYSLHFLNQKSVLVLLWGLLSLEKD